MNANQMERAAPAIANDGPKDDQLPSKIGLNNTSLARAPQPAANDPVADAAYRATRRKVNKTGRSMGQFADSRFRKRNGPPKGKAWVWFTAEMLESPAMRALSRSGRLVLDRLMVEHLHHGGCENGNLPVGYNDFERFGVWRGAIKGAIAEVAAVGLITRIHTGQKCYGQAKGSLSTYRLEWLPDSGNPARNLWRRFKTLNEAQAAMAAATERARANRADDGNVRKRLAELASRGATGRDLEEGSHVRTWASPGKMDQN